MAERTREASAGEIWRDTDETHPRSMVEILQVRGRIAYRRTSLDEPRQGRLTYLPDGMFYRRFTFAYKNEGAWRKAALKAKRPILGSLNIDTPPLSSRSDEVTADDAARDVMGDLEIDAMLLAFQRACERCATDGDSRLAANAKERAICRNALRAKLARSLPGSEGNEALDFVGTVARLNWDGEELPDGSEYVQENDDARDTLMSLITQARDILDSTAQAELELS